LAFRAWRNASARLLFVKKVIREIMLLLWKVVRVYLWKLLLPHLRKIAFVTVAAVAVIGILAVLLASAC
jgi:hypothetical protein